MNLQEIEKKITEVSQDYIDEYDTKPLLQSEIESYFRENRWYRKLIDRLFHFSRYQRIKTICDDLDSYVSGANEEFIQRMQLVHKEFFQDVEGLALDEQQQRAVITDDNYNLVLAGAGSGKTLTVAAKVKYLVEIKNVPPSRILLMSFTRKAAEEMTERIREKMKIPVSASTFHGLGYKIIYEVEHKRPDVVTESEVIVQRFFKELAMKDKDLIIKILYFVGMYMNYYEFGDQTYEEMIRNSKMYSLYTFQSQFGRSILTEQIEKLKKREESAERISGKSGRNSLKEDRSDREEQQKIRDEIYRLQQERTTIVGERVKSIEEAKIANFLFLNGIRYKYERPYPYDLRDNYRKNYRPDFYLPDYDIYWEHFGINEEGDAPWLSKVEEQKYKNGIIWKRNLHKQNRTKLIESYSYQNQNGQFENNLKKILKENGIVPKPVNHEKIYRTLFVEGQDQSIISFQKLMSTFLNLFKSNGYEQDWFKEIRLQDLMIRDRLFFDIAEKLIDYYQSEMEEQIKIDFNDMINRASSYVIERKWTCDYQYIIVDEYQDISVARYKLLKALVQQTKAKLLCVGDDWQSIYRFTGSDLSLFSDFEKFWGRYQLMRIEKTYRNAQQLIDIAGKFVQKNPSQLRKSLLSDRSEEKPVYCIPYRSVKSSKESNGESTASNSSDLSQFNLRSPSDALQYSLNIISRREGGESCRVMLLGRNNTDINMILESRYYDTEQGVSIIEKDSRFEKVTEESGEMIQSRDFPSIHLEFLTVHKAKGLQADYVVILNLKNDVTGFPNQISDDPVLRFVLSEPEKYDYAEERRLFYVALTRTKKSVFLLSPVLNESVFCEEIMKDYQLEYQCPDGIKLKKTDLPECPRCRGGKLVLRHSGRNEFLGCSNYPLCDYTIPDVSVLENPIRCHCGGYMIRRNGKYGLFLSCSNYPHCDVTLKKLWGARREEEYMKRIAKSESERGQRKSEVLSGTATTSQPGPKKIPSNRGSLWTADEEMMLMKEYQSKLSVKEIAAVHGRSEGAIHSRIKKMKEEGRLT